MRINRPEDKAWLSAHANELPPSFCRPQQIDVAVAEAVKALLSEEETTEKKRYQGLAELENNANL